MLGVFFSFFKYSKIRSLETGYMVVTILLGKNADLTHCSQTPHTGAKFKQYHNHGSAVVQYWVDIHDIV